MDLKKALSLRYIVLLIVFWSAASAFGQSELSKKQEDNLAASNFYGIPIGIPVVEWLEYLVNMVNEDIIRFPEHGSFRHQIIGDAYHWLGHIYEERREWQRALDMHSKSHAHHLLSDYRFSPMILNYNAVDHALYHLKVVSNRLGSPMPFGTRKHGVSEQNNPEIGDRNQYKKEIEKIYQRSNLTLPQAFCGAMFQ